MKLERLFNHKVLMAIDTTGSVSDVIVTNGYFDLENDWPTVKNSDNVIFLYPEDHITHPGFEEYLLNDTL